MAGRAFRIKVQLDVHAVTCPGVWLCPNGKVALQIDALDSCVESRKINPIFPLLFHDRFTFSKIFVQTASLADLQRILEREFLFAELIQWTTSTHRRGITLATFEINLSDLLYPASCFKGLLAGVDVDLLMEPTKCFPGIIAPKIEVSTKTIVEEVSGSYDTSMSKCYVINPKMINSKQTTCGQRKRPVKGIIRQRRVCHTKPRSQSCRPYRQRSSSVGESPHCDTTSQCIDQCYHSVRKDPRPCVRRQAEADIVRDDDIHVTDNCPVCLKYNCYFSKCDDDSDVAKRCSDIKRRCHRRLLDTGECCCVCRSSDERERARVSLLQAKIRNLQKAREKMCVTEPMIQLDIEESDPSVCEYSRDHSRGYEFYKDLEKFYKRMYKQAKLRAQEVDC